MVIPSYGPAGRSYSDQIRRSEHLSADDRRTTFDAMIGIALGVAIAG